MFPPLTEAALPPLRRTDAQAERVRTRRMRRRQSRVWDRRAVNIFLLWHCFALFVWLVPGNWPIVKMVVPPGPGGPVRPYLTATGFQQSWLMFSPNPDNNDVFITAHVVFQDGTTRDFLFPRMRDMPYGPKYRRERWRKMEEVANFQAPLWPALANYAARQVTRSPQNPPVFVSLTRHFRLVPPPGIPLPPYTEELFYREMMGRKAVRP